MDKNMEFVQSKRIERTVQALKKNNMEAYVAEDTGQLKELLRTLIQDGEAVGIGGSMTLFETGALDYVRSLPVNLLDRYKTDGTPEAIRDIYIRSLDADTYITSSNAITEQGELYNVDGRGNRVAAMIYGPKQVVVIVGANKIVANLEEAEMRMKKISAPANNVRLELPNPCTVKGECMDCKGKTRICNDYVVIRWQNTDRIKVIILPESYGY